MIVGWLVQRFLMLAGPTLATYGITLGDSFAVAITGVVMALIGVVLSWFGRKKALNTEPPK